MVVGLSDTRLFPINDVAVRLRVPDRYYPQSSTGYVCVSSSAMTWRVGPFPLPRVVYEENIGAGVDNLESLITVRSKREDMCSVLPFITRPPAPAVPHCCRFRFSGNPAGPSLPRTVNRLDCRTSGLVVVAKTDRAATELSRSFPYWSVRK